MRRVVGRAMARSINAVAALLAPKLPNGPDQIVH